MRVLYLFISIVSCLSINLYGKDSTSTKSSFFGFQLYSSYDYKNLHFATDFSISLGRHELYLGPEYIKVIINPLFGDEIDKFGKTAWGLNLGYRCYFPYSKKRVSALFQFNYSLYKIDYTEYQLGPPYYSTHKGLLIENTGSLGVHFNINKHLFINSEVGIGSFSGFFLIFDSFFPSASICIGYKFIK
jgi:hypothetical protein